MIKIPKITLDNLHFLTVEVNSQISTLQRYLLNPNEELARNIVDRWGYTNNLKNRIQNGNFRYLIKQQQNKPAQVSLRNVENIAVILDELTEQSRFIVEELTQVNDFSLVQPKLLVLVCSQVKLAIALIEPALSSQKSPDALKIAKKADLIKRKINQLVKKYEESFTKHKQTRDFVHVLFVARNFQNMAEKITQISEAIISRNIGQNVNTDRFQSLNQFVNDLSVSEQELTINPIAETRSGSAISGITTKNTNEPIAVFKDGNKSKVKGERLGVESWHSIYPGLAPKILAYEKRGESAAILIEHLPGYTFEKLVLNESNELVNLALKALNKTLRKVWQETRNEEPQLANFGVQLKKRMPDVYKIHPEFNYTNKTICGHFIPSFNDLIDQTIEFEKILSSPFSVYIHGDFNIDNVIFDPIENRINFIDLHRSKYMDYVQDVSVFMVSNYRLQVFDGPVRERLLAVIIAFYNSTRRYAIKQGDTQFDLRLAFGLARSFATSTRFILDKSLANKMFLKARYLLELGLSTKPNKRFKLPIQELFFD
ncbi:phosphotransferase [Algibacillus agarilyticus]|uniref:phosphotransferase n=1 Tax=Algibacillus agarilyticus TaxID=2234133 RepID=UPI000DCFAB19|nr:phosphotransferase [Algibacillus agarilyticus]